MMAGSATAVTEEWIRERVGLAHENLEDVKSLALPGTYHEKITALGSSLKKFTRLKNLDLSRNSLNSIKGLENCQLLESLNLYYNNVSSLEDLSCLRHNSKLTNLDLRLNPVARTEPDYRLFVVDILPELKVLDDRPVRDAEREVARGHFGVTADSTTQDDIAPNRNSKPSSKARIIPSGMALTSMGPDDCAVLNILAKADVPLPENTASAASYPSVQEYGLNGLKQVAIEELSSACTDGRKGAATNQQEYMHSKTSLYQSLYPNIPVNRSAGELGALPLHEEADAYSTFMGKGHFTANPLVQDVEEPKHPASREAQEPAAGSQDVPDRTSEKKHLVTLLDLVDRYWNGSRSLHDNPKFLKLARDLLAKISGETSAVLQQHVSELKVENKRLLASAKIAESLSKVKAQLDETETEMEHLRKRLSELQEENNGLRLAVLANGKNTSCLGSYLPADSSGPPQREWEELKRENYQLQFKVKTYSQMQELAKMLQESHKSLVQTNDHLLREIEELRCKSRSDVQTALQNGASYTSGGVNNR